MIKCIMQLKTIASVPSFSMEFEIATKSMAIEYVKRTLSIMPARWLMGATLFINENVDETFGRTKTVEFECQEEIKVRIV